MTLLEFIKQQFTGYEVFDEIKHSNTIYDKYIIINAIGGDNVYSHGSNANYQLAIRTTDPLTTLSEIQEIAKNISGTYFSNNEETMTKVLCNMPYKAQVFEEANDMYYTEFILPIFLIITKNVEDISGIMIDGETFQVENANLSYSTTVDNQRISTSELNQTDITMCSLQLQFSSITYNNIFNQKVRKIMFGKIAKSTTFTIVITFTGGATESLSMKLLSALRNKDRATLPTTTYVFGV